MLHDDNADLYDVLVKPDAAQGLYYRGEIHDMIRKFMNVLCDNRTGTMRKKESSLTKQTKLRKILKEYEYPRDCLGDIMDAIIK